MILVLGGKGKTGRKVGARLIAQGENVRIGSRSETPPFDWETPGEWPAALNGIDKVYVTFQPDLAVPGARKLIAEFTAQAVKSGVRKLVLLSGKGEKEAELCEQVVMDAGAEWTIVRASWFNQNFSESFLLDPIVAGHVALPKSEALVLSLIRTISLMSSLRLARRPTCWPGLRADRSAPVDVPRRCS